MARCASSSRRSCWRSPLTAFSPPNGTKAAMPCAFPRILRIRDDKPVERNRYPCRRARSGREESAAEEDGEEMQQERMKVA